ncbi:hypothetical protein VZ95_18430 [Elstera litoralis]|uniref:Uncharacterized protein n=1 Tax=Elstera litoralis TaxID=552518 RepID=A0A0F3IP70_9PROT|nr:hypothetical protein [Elstera litoralis]KJV08338.1 hypothetical protein VZ95_18430 [Elstera litoralis]
MTSFWHRLVNFFMVQERITVPKPRAVNNCSACRFWVAPDKITQKEVPSTRAIQWAKDNGFGRCTAKAAPDQNKARGETKRFTMPTDGCGQYAKRPETALPAR